MGALLSLPLLALPSVGTVRHVLRYATKKQLTIHSSLRLAQAAAVRRLVLLCAAHAGNVVTGRWCLCASRVEETDNVRLVLPHVLHTPSYS